LGSHRLVLTRRVGWHQVPVHSFHNISWIDVEENAKLYVHNPNPQWRNIEDCGVDQVSTA
jgi:hypothetical protein